MSHMIPAPHFLRKLCRAIQSLDTRIRASVITKRLHYTLNWDEFSRVKHTWNSANIKIVEIHCIS